LIYYRRKKNGKRSERAEQESRDINVALFALIPEREGFQRKARTYIVRAFFVL
jgi:hypothetical protein